jgi:rhodanese-related sulfurtransferase
MNVQPSTLSLNVKLGSIAAALAVLALFAGSSYRGTRVPLNPKELAYRIQNELDHVTSSELASWIMENKTGYRIVDLQDEQSFHSYHIPGAENKSLPSLLDAPYDTSETIVLYSEGGVHSAQAMFLLWAQGYNNVLMLKGGINDWKDEILHPNLSKADSGANPRAFAEAKARSRFFGGVFVTFPNRPQLAVPRVGKEREKIRNEC